MKEEEKILYGFGETKRIVSVQQISSKEMRIYIRDGEKVKFVDKRFYPFFFASDDSLLPSFDGIYWKKRLMGDEFYKFIFAFETWSDMNKAIRMIAKRLGRPITGKQRFKEIYVNYEPITQFLVQSGETLFKGMRYDDLNILYLKVLAIIENNTIFHSRYFNQIFAIALADNNGWNKLIYRKTKSITEKDILLEFAKIIQEKDSDLIIGFDVINELVYLNSRFENYNLNLPIGRDGSSMFVDVINKIRVGERFAPSIMISGRHIVDLLQMLSLSKTLTRELDDLSIQNVTKFFGIEIPEYEPIEDSKIPLTADRNPEQLYKKLNSEIQIISELSNQLLPQYFYQAQFVPMNFDQIIYSGISSKIELLMVREYLRKRHSIPVPNERVSLTGGYADVFYRGLFDRIVYADVESLYPSIIINEKISPSSDKLQVFLKLITILTRERLKYKRMRDQSKNNTLKKHYDIIQNAYKILINSFYGYLGFSDGIFNDFKKSNEVTIKGQELLKKLIREFQKRGCLVIEVDTDGLYISPQKEITEDEEKMLVEEVNRSIPAGINLIFGGRYKRMLSYEKKNYALLTYDDNLIIKGSALISKSIENYALNFIKECIRCIITDNINLIPNLYIKLRSDLQNLRINIMDLAKTEILRDSYQQYDEAVKSGRRQRSAAYELAYKYFGDKFYPGMKIVYYITGNDPNAKVFENCELVEFFNPNIPNVNIPYYLRRLDEYISRFEVFFTKEDFNALFPKENGFIFDTKPKVINSVIKDQN